MHCQRRSQARYSCDRLPQTTAASWLLPIYIENSNRCMCKICIFTQARVPIVQHEMQLIPKLPRSRPRASTPGMLRTSDAWGHWTAPVKLHACNLLGCGLEVAKYTCDRIESCRHADMQETLKELHSIKSRSPGIHLPVAVSVEEVALKWVCCVCWFAQFWKSGGMYAMPFL